MYEYLNLIIVRYEVQFTPNPLYLGGERIQSLQSLGLRLVL